MTYTTEHRNAAVLRVLNEATGPLTPTQIASKIGEPWCRDGSAPISPVLKRIGAVKAEKFGQWLKPKE